MAVGMNILIIGAADGGTSELFDFMEQAMPWLLVVTAKGHFNFIDTVLNDREYANVPLHKDQGCCVTTRQRRITMQQSAEQDVATTARCAEDEGLFSSWLTSFS